MIKRGKIARTQKARSPSGEGPDGARSSSSSPLPSPPALPHSSASPSLPLVTLRMGFGDALVKAVAAIAMAQGRVSEEMEGRMLVAIPR